MNLRAETQRTRSLGEEPVEREPPLSSGQILAKGRLDSIAPCGEVTETQ